MSKRRLPSRTSTRKRKRLPFDVSVEEPSLGDPHVESLALESLAASMLRLEELPHAAAVEHRWRPFRMNLSVALYYEGK